jgi:MoaA/NifB/PqqE/SkfB family radical SAM enzyme
MQAVIIPTDRCNLRCKHCLRSQYKDGDLGLDDLMLFFSQFEHHFLVNNFCLTGGEPTLHKDFLGILKILRAFDSIGTIVTNGQNFKGIEEIVSCKEIFCFVLISLEGPNAAINNAIRGKGSFEKAIKAIKFLKKNGVKVQIRNTLNAKNINYIKEMFHFAKDLEIDLLGFSAIQPCENGVKNDILITIDRFEKAKDEYEKYSVKYPEVKNFFGTRHIEPLTDPEWPQNLCRPMNDNDGEITLKPNGDVSLCCDLSDFDFNGYMFGKNDQQKLSHILGNIKRDSFDEILKNREMIRDFIIERRRLDALEGRLTGSRQCICENCKFYFYKEA